MAEGMQLGAWAEDRAVIEDSLITGLGNDAGAPRDIRFRRIVAQIVACRESREEAEYDRAGAFVLTDKQWSENRPKETSRVLRLPTGFIKLTGKIFLINLAGNGHSIDYSGEDVDLEAILYSLGASTFPTLLYSPEKNASMLTWYPHGIHNDEVSESLTIYGDEPTPEKITQAINRAYEGELITPDQTRKEWQVWQNPSKGWAHEEAEARIQYVIRIALYGAFLHCSIRLEQSGKDGRTDLEITTDQTTRNNRIVHHAVLEFKVLRERGSKGNTVTDRDNIESMEKGLRQAYYYANARNFRECMLCCYDMRDNNAGLEATFSVIKKNAETLMVHLRYWYLYRSSEHLRQCRVAEILNNEKTPPSPR